MGRKEVWCSAVSVHQQLLYQEQAVLNLNHNCYYAVALQDSGGEELEVCRQLAHRLRNTVPFLKNQQLLLEEKLQAARQGRKLEVLVFV